MKQFDEIEFDAMTRVSIQGIPFWLSTDTILLGNAKKLECLKMGSHLPNGKPPVFASAKKKDCH